MPAIGQRQAAGYPLRLKFRNHRIYPPASGEPRTGPDAWRELLARGQS